MITKTDLSSINLSPTKKDFYQIWNELLDTAKKISERWDPTSTNESDPGIVLLKVLAAIADTLNYNIDKNILEAFMPSAAQEESMRKLCEMLGYDMKYYQSAMTQVKFTYIGEDPISSNGLIIPEFMTITNVDKDISYIVTDFGKLITEDNKTVTLNCIEGQLVQCESENDNIISINQIDDRFRYYLPETQVAENGIFIFTISDGVRKSVKWTKVNNLNTQSPGAEVYKFGYDSREARPYVQFSEDIAQVMEDGLLIYYVRTAGVNGNISAKTLSTFELPTDESWKDLEESDFIVTNPNAAKNGSNIETLEAAYSNYKKTIGTFDTLVTCRDYMNRIYQLMDDLNNPLVSNIIVSDIRDDINRSIMLCTMNDYGIRYVDKSRKNTSTSTDLISHFDLVLYPFKTITGLNTYDEYTKSFTYDSSNNAEIKADIKDLKTISHIFKEPSEDDIVCIKNYLKLNAKITTVNKVNVAEELSILSNIKEALYTNFNMRQLDFGEEIPYDSILKVIELADSRIKTVILDEPILKTKFLTAKNDEYEMNNKDTATSFAGNKAYNKLALRNILAGRVELLNYNTDFKYSLDEKPKAISGGQASYPESGKTISKLESEFLPGAIPENGYLLKDNEVIKFRFPNLKTIITYPAYINYYLKLKNASTIITDGSEYQLDDDEYLLINYTKTEQETNQKSIINLYYPAGTIIKPTGIGLKDSDTYHSEDNGRHPWTKTSGYDFSQYEEVTDPSGMFTFGPGEQLEIRDFVQVILDEPITNLYWKLNSNTVIAATNGEHTLEDGEYIFYTDINKTNIAYYGSGTKVTNNSNKAIAASDTNDNLDIAEIFENGINAIPWIQFNLNSTNTIILTEYQYINLTKDDTIKTITLASGTLDNDWKECSAATWKYASGAEGNLANNQLDGKNWEARSLLEFNLGPNSTQILTNKDHIKIHCTDDTPSTTIPDLSNISVKSNIVIQTATDIFNKPTLAEIKLLCVEKMSINDVTFGNVNNYWTNITGQAVGAGLEFGVAIPSNTFGLLTIYLTDLNGSAEAKMSQNVWIESSDLTPTIYNNFDSTHDSWSWWSYSSYPTYDPSKTYNLNDIVKYEGEAYYCTTAIVNPETWNPNHWHTIGTSRYYLRKGINTIKFDSSNSGGTFMIHCNGDKAKIVLTLGQLDIIKAKTNKYGINVETIDYRPEEAGSTATTETALAKALLEATIAADITKEFYYNCPIDNSFAIDLNLDNEEKLSDPEVWYSYNNINNKFVISEIDADWLDYGITIAKSSKVK